MLRSVLVFPVLCLTLVAAADQEPSREMGINKYDVIWTTPSQDARGSMPLGNGEVVLNAWIEASTGDLVFYIGRSDSLSEISRILKLSKIRVHLDSTPFKSSDLQWHLDLQRGEMTVSAGDAVLKLFVDSDSDTIFIGGSLPTSTQVSVSNEPWRTEPHTLAGEESNSAWSAMGGPFPLTESADHEISVDPNSIGFYHRNEVSVVPTLWENQSLSGLPGAFDPLIHRSFGAVIRSDQLRAEGPMQLRSDHPLKSFQIVIAAHCAQTATADEWLGSTITQAQRANFETASRRTTAFWKSFWQRSEFDCSEPLIARGYNLQRYVQACQGRGHFPFKFNGGTYTVEPKAMGKPWNPDWRAWGDAQWYQNLRHMQHPMLASGDFEMMEPFFRLYESVRPLAESRTQKYHHATGAYFPETMSMFGTYAGSDYGWDRKGLTPDDVQSPWWRYAWNQGLELVALMLDRWDYTRDEKFLRDRTLPMATSVLNYFDTRFKKDARGRIVLDPAQSVETYWYDVVNDMPSTAGLIAVTQRLSNLPERLLSSEQRQFFERMAKSCPELPLRTKDGVELLSPAQKYKPETSNVENPELYAVWPFRLVCLQSPKLLDQGIAAYNSRLFHQDVGWGNDGDAAALLGMTDEAARILKIKCENSNPAYRWPATWGPNFDWLPDQNHGGNLLETTDLMLIQGEPLEAGGKILVLPSWPKKWDVDFKLRAPGKTTVECKTEGGKITKLKVSPASRMKDVVIAPSWR